MLGSRRQSSLFLSAARTKSPARYFTGQCSFEKNLARRTARGSALTAVTGGLTFTGLSRRMARGAASSPAATTRNLLAKDMNVWYQTPSLSRTYDCQPGAREGEL